MTLSSKTVKELRKIAREEGIRTSGRKAVLVDRLEMV